MVELRPIVPGDPSYDWRGNTRGLSAEHAEGVGAYEDNQLVGSLTWRDLPNALYIVAAYVAPQFREQGLLKRMFSYVTSLHPDKPIESGSEEGNPVKGLQDLHNYHTTRGLALGSRLTIRPIYDILRDYDEEQDRKENLGQGEGDESRQAVGRSQPQAQGYVVISGNEGEEYAWPDFDDIHEISLAAVENHQGYRDPGLVEGAVGNTQMMQQYGQHEDIFDTAAHLIAKIQRQQAIVEGNKRTATNVGLAFLANNGYDISPVVDSEQKEDELVRFIMEISTNDDAIGELAQFLRENCKPEKTAGLFKEDGLGTAFWYDPESGIHFGDTHYMIFHNMFGSPDENNYEQRHQGVYGWIYPDPHDTEHGDEPDYDINFGTDFGAHANFNASPQLEREAVEEIEGQIGYPATDVYSNWSDRYHEKNAGHAYESEDLDEAQADGAACQNCGSMVAPNEICGNCGTANLSWWTENRGLAPFKGSVKTAITYDGQNYSCFAFLPPMLYLGNRHHMAIMQQLLQHGWTWEQLMEAKQLWGWSGDSPHGEEPYIGLYLQTDAAILDKSLLPELEAAFTKLTGIDKFVMKSNTDPTNEEYAPDWDSHYGDEGFYTNVPGVLAYNSSTGQSEYWDATAVTASWKEDKEFEKLVLLDNLWSIGYNTKTTSMWEEQFEEPVEENLEDFAQEEGQLTDEQKAEQGVSGPFNIDGWTVYERDCGDVYPTHDALWIDRTNNIILIGYQGHHHDIGKDSPFIQNIIGQMDPYNQTAGHFRTEPSKTEPHPAGFLWHGDDATKDEKNVIKQVLKQHYNVDKLKSLYKEIPDAYSEENDYYDDGYEDSGY